MAFMGYRAYRAYMAAMLQGHRPIAQGCSAKAFERWATGADKCGCILVLVSGNDGHVVDCID